MSRDLHTYVCLEDYCNASFKSYRPEDTCPECGSPEIEVERTYLDESRDYTGV